MRTIVLKLGGSVITDKAGNRKVLHRQTVQRIAGEIKAAQESGLFRLVVVHGVGAFGHSLVKEYGINDGLHSPDGLKGWVETHLSVADLNREVVAIFREQGLHAFPVQPSACMVQSGKKITQGNFDALQQMQSTHPALIPVLYGDMVADTSLGASVVSGDAIAPFIANKLGADEVFLGTDVRGIFTGDPKKKGSGVEVIPSITDANFSKVLHQVTGSGSVDVTGGMEGKLRQLGELLKGIPAFIFDLQPPGNVERLLTGTGNVPGTRIHLENF